MTTCLGKSRSFGLPRVPFVNCCQFMYYFLFGFDGRIWDLIVSENCLSLYFSQWIHMINVHKRCLQNYYIVPYALTVNPVILFKV